MNGRPEPMMFSSLQVEADREAFLALARSPRRRKSSIPPDERRRIAIERERKLEEQRTGRSRESLIAEARELEASGLSRRQISKRLTINREKLARWLGPKVVLTDDLRVAVAELQQDGATCAAIAAKTGLSRSVVQELLRPAIRLQA